MIILIPHVNKIIQPQEIFVKTTEIIPYPYECRITIHVLHIENIKSEIPL